MTSYEIWKRTKVPFQMIDRYRSDENKIENMTLKTAGKIYNFYLELQDKG